MSSNPNPYSRYRDACRTNTPAEKREDATTPDHMLGESRMVANDIPEPYKPGESVQEAVDLAIALRRPLLLQGEPGCGKTRLAYHVAYMLGWPLETAYLKSSSRAEETLYHYDAVSRLYDAQLGEKASNDPTDASRYIRLGPLGRAIVRAKHNRHSVVLLDEIDKADLDFPNDLLRELDRMEFKVPETGEEHRVDKKSEAVPLVLITHNEEKALPTAFLRRCIFHYLTFPESEDALFRVVETHWAEKRQTEQTLNPDLAQAAARVLLRLRKIPTLTKKPGLSELLDWVLWLHRENTTDAETLESTEFGKLPALGVLLKSKSDQDAAIESKNTDSGSRAAS